MRPIAIVFVLLAALMAIPAVVHAQDAGPAPDAGPAVTAPVMMPTGPALGVAGELVTAIKAGEWRRVCALGLILFVALCTWLATKWDAASELLDGRDWLKVTFAFAMSFAGAVGSALLTSVAVDFSLFKAAAEVAILATGGYAVLWKKLLLPLGQWAVGKLA